MRDSCERLREFALAMQVLSLRKNEESSHRFDVEQIFIYYHIKDSLKDKMKFNDFTL